MRRPPRVKRARTHGGFADALRYLIPLTVVWGGPVVVAALMRPTPLEREALFPDAGERRVVEVGERSDDGSQPASLTTMWTSRHAITWPYDTGTVTDVWVKPGQRPADGTALFSVDGAAVIAQVTGRPLYRDIGYGLTGPDVDWIDQLIVSSGLSAASTLDSQGRATSATSRAIATLQELGGVDKPDGVLHTTSVLYLGDPAPTIAEVLVQRGQRLELGAELLVFPRTLIAATLTLNGPPGRQGLVQQSPVVVSIGERSVRLSAIKFSREDLRQLSQLLDPDEPVIDDALVRRRTAARVGSVPASAIVTSADGVHRCIFQVGSEGSIRPRLLATGSVESAEAGVAYVPAQLIGHKIVSNPSVTVDVQCPS